MLKKALEKKKRGKYKTYFEKNDEGIKSTWAFLPVLALLPSGDHAQDSLEDKNHLEQSRAPGPFVSAKATLK